MSATFRKSAAMRYRRWSSLYYYAHGKIALDPAYPLVARLLKDSPRPLLDIGCGMGLLAAYLRAHQHRAPIVGMDVDAEKVSLAQGILGHENIRFHAGDALVTFPEHSGDVVMLDVLHYFSDDEQQQLLEKLAASVAPGGIALIRVTLNEPTLRFALTRLEEWFIKIIRWIPVSGSNFPTREEVSAPFRQAGFQEEIRPLWGITPFNSYLFSYRRAA